MEARGGGRERVMTSAPKPPVNKSDHSFVAGEGWSGGI